MLRVVSLWMSFCLALLAQRPQNVMLVVNDASSESRDIAQYYTATRHIPSRNVCRLSTTTDERIKREIFDEQIAKPIAACLKSRHLEDQILYLVTTLGLPLAIYGTEDKLGTYASVDSELTLLYSDMKSGTRHSLAGPIPNPFFKSRDVPFRHPQFPIYLVTRLAAFDVADVKAMIDRSLIAKNRGKFVVDLKSESDEPGNDWLRNAAILLPTNRLVMDESEKVIYGEKNVLGYASWGSNDHNRHDRNLHFSWEPGAIVTEFVSTDARTFKTPPANWTISTDWKDPKAWFANTPQSLTADYIHQGATAASGHTNEPYLAFCPRPDYVLPAYYSGQNVAESFYSGIPALSWQNVIIGDPLCSLGKP